MKKRFSLLLALMMFTTLFTGVVYAEAPASDFSEHVTLTLTNVQTVEGWNYTDGDAYCKSLSDKFNYDIEVTHVTNDTWAERMRIWVTSGDMTDVSNYNFVYL